MARAGSPGTPAPWRVWLAAVRPRTLPAAVTPVVVGTAIALRQGRFDGPAAAECLAFALLIQVGTNFANDYYDFVRGADNARRVGPVRAVAAGWVAPETMRGAMGIVFAAAFAVGLGLVSRGGPWLLVIGLASIACGIGYTGGPFPLGYHGLGDIFVFLFFGVVAVTATAFVQTGRLSGDAFLASVPIGLLAANILVVNNYRDCESDAAAGKRTLVVRFGRRFSRAQYGGSLAVALAAPFAAWRYGGGVGSLLPLTLAPWAWSLTRRLRAAKRPDEGQSAQALVALLGDTAKFLAFYGVLYALGALL